jgi:AmpD protein
MQYQVDITTGLLEGVRFLASPHCDERPAGTAVDLLVVHGISLPPGEFGGPWVQQLFLGKLEVSAHPYFIQVAALKVAAHLLVRRDGELLQFVPFDRRAWHAGVSRFEGREACNDFSIGVELEGSDELAYAPVQYVRLAEVCQALLQAYPGIRPERIVGHSDVAPGRKTDPGPGFDWPHFRTQLQAKLYTG